MIEPPVSDSFETCLNGLQSSINYFAFRYQVDGHYAMSYEDLRALGNFTAYRIWLRYRDRPIKVFKYLFILAFERKIRTEQHKHFVAPTRVMPLNSYWPFTGKGRRPYQVQRVAWLMVQAAYPEGFSNPHLTEYHYRLKGKLNPV